MEILHTPLGPVLVRNPRERFWARFWLALIATNGGR